LFFKGRDRGISVAPMTMLLSFYAAEGIVFAADSQITIPGTTTTAVEPQRKVLRVRGVGTGDGAIGYFGLAQVQGQPLTPWLKDTLRGWPGGDAVALGQFVTDALLADATGNELRQVSAFHIGAFEDRGGVRLPVFVYARNVDLGPTGYAPLGRFDVDEQLLARDLVGAPDVRRVLRAWATKNGLPVWYRNGDLGFFAPVWEGIERAAQLIIAQHGYQAPNTLDDWEKFARTLIVTTSNLYRLLYSRGAPLIGNRVFSETLAWP
jgi:hypothetical protein